jgi:hypothetical protein
MKVPGISMPRLFRLGRSADQLTKRSSECSSTMGTHIPEFGHTLLRISSTCAVIAFGAFGGSGASVRLELRKSICFRALTVNKW